MINSVLQNGTIHKIESALEVGFRHWEWVATANEYPIGVSTDEALRSALAIKLWRGRTDDEIIDCIRDATLHISNDPTGDSNVILNTALYELAAGAHPEALEDALVSRDGFDKSVFYLAQLVVYGKFVSI